jgi:8-oxo-dGTP pyrophosphatase MutT (NUDIX family)
MVSSSNQTLDPLSRKLLTLCFVQEGSRILLGMKKRGFGEGKWNGFGGKVEPGETIEEAAHRELKEECGIEVARMEHAGMIDQSIAGNPVIREIHVFRASGVLGEPSESDEMAPQWFDVSELPYDRMWECDVPWYPLLLAGKRFTARVSLDNEKKMLEHEVKEA